MTRVIFTLNFVTSYSSYGAERNGLSLEWFARLWTTNYNVRLDCSCLPDMDLGKWKDMKLKWSQLWSTFQQSKRFISASV